MEEMFYQKYWSKVEQYLGHEHPILGLISIPAIGGLIGLAIACGIKGQNTEKIYLEGIVIKESGSIIKDFKSNGWNNPTYFLQVKTSEGIYTLDIFDEDCLNGHHPLEALALTIEEGDEIKFIKEKGEWGNEFRENKICNVYPSELTILDKK